jgi:hypothetical protein
MFRRLYLPAKILYLSARVALLIAYIQWLLSEVAEAQLEENLALYNSISLKPNWDSMLHMFVSYAALYNFTEIEDKIRNIVLFDLKRIPSQVDRKKNEDFITNLLFEMYRSSLLDRCKLEVLINYNPGFHLMIRDDKALNEGQEVDAGINALYFNAKNILYLYQFDIYGNAEQYTQSFSHELRHALDTFNNFKNGFCLHEGYPQASIYGSKTEESCATGSVDALRVSRLIKKDFKRVVRLYEASNVLGTRRTQNQSDQLSQLGMLLKASGYTASGFSDYSVPDWEWVTKVYGFNSTTQAYQWNPSGNALPYKILVNPMGAKTFWLVKYLLAYNPQLKQGVWALSIPLNVSEANLIEDLLNNIMFRMSVLKNYYKKAEFSYEAGAHIDEVLSPYTHPVLHQNKKTTLRSWLFPRLSAHEKTRYTKEFKTCLNQQNSQAENRKRGLKLA